MNIETKLNELGFFLSTPPTAAGNYLPYVQTGNLLYLAGTICLIDGNMTHIGKVGQKHSIESGYKAAEVCALNTLANIKLAIGSLDAVKKFVFVSGYVNAIEGFMDSPAIINGASDLFVKLYGERGKHARAAVAVAGLPKDSTVEIQCIVEV